MITIEYVPYVGLIHDGTKFVRTKMKDGLLHFFEWDNTNVSCDQLDKKTVDDIKAMKVDGVKYLGFVELKQ